MQTKQQQNIPTILKKYHKLMKRGKPLYVEAYKIMAASTQVIEMKFGAGGGGSPEYSPTAYYACLQDMMTSWAQARRAGAPSQINIESLAYCYSAIVSTLDFGVIQNQEEKIVDAATFLLQGASVIHGSGLQQARSASPVAQKYAIITLQFVLHSKSEAQWTRESNVAMILRAMLEKCSEY